MIAFLQDFEAACDACNIHDGAKMWLFKNYVTGSVDAIIKARVVLSTGAAK